MKNSKFSKFIYFCALFFLLPIIGKAADIEIVGSTTSIKLNKNRTANISESFEIYYINSTSKFDRILDKKLTIYRDDKSKNTTNSVISDIKTDLNNTIKKTNQKDIISLNLLGKKDSIETASLNYTYDLGRDTSNKFDEFYYNIISNFDNVISGVSFEIILPKDSKVEQVNFSINGEYNLTPDDVTYYIEGNVITGYLNLMLNENDVFSVRLQFPNNYFEKAKNTFNNLNYLFLILPIITIVILGYYWFKYGYKNKRKNINSFYPPHDFDPAEVVYLYKGKIEEHDLGSLIIYLANKGYLRIEENDDGYKLGKPNSFKFVKEKEYDLRNAAQKMIYRGIFKDREISELSDIEYTIQDQLLDVKKVIDTKDNMIKLFNRHINKTKLISIILIILSLITINIIPIREMNVSYLIVPVLSFVMLFGLAVMFMFNIKGISKIILGLIFLGGSLYISLNVLLSQNILLIIYVVGIVSSFIAAFIYNKLPIRTKFGNEKLGEVNGFKLTLQNMNQERLKQLLKEDPNYFYDMVPYAYIFDILSIWINKGKNIIITRPNWHITKEEFNLLREETFFKNIIFTTTQVMIKGIYAKKESSQLEFKRDEINSKLNN